MNHDVFISYSTKDRAVATTICDSLETNGIVCWMAPRDVRPGQDWPAEIIRALDGAKASVLVFSEHANASEQITREVTRAIQQGVTVVPLRIEDVQPTESLAYFLGTPHWLDAVTPPFERHLADLADTLKSIIAPSLSTTTTPTTTTTLDTSQSSSTLSLREHIRRARQREISEGDDAGNLSVRYEQLQAELVDQIDRRAFAEARRTVALMLRLRPDDDGATEALAFLAERESERYDSAGKTARPATSPDPRECKRHAPPAPWFDSAAIGRLVIGVLIGALSGALIGRFAYNSSAGAYDSWADKEGRSGLEADTQPVYVPTSGHDRYWFQDAAATDFYIIFAVSSLIGLGTGAARSLLWGRRRRLDPGRRIGRAIPMAINGMLVALGWTFLWGTFAGQMDGTGTEMATAAYCALLVFQATWVTAAPRPLRVVICFGAAGAGYAVAALAQQKNSAPGLILAVAFGASTGLAYLAFGRWFPRQRSRVHPRPLGPIMNALVSPFFRTDEERRGFEPGVTHSRS